jgi:large subunit ribosomal protein L17
MRHLKSGRKLNRTSSHRKALMRNLATALFEHKKIKTTEAKAKELRPYAERLITKAKNALAREKQGLLPEGQTIDLHNRRTVARYLSSKAVLQELFDTIAPAVEERPGGYTRIIKTGTRFGDAGRTAIIELVDWSQPQDGAVSMKRKRKATKGKKSTKAPSDEAADVKTPKKKKAVAAVSDKQVQEEKIEEITQIADNEVESPVETPVAVETETAAENNTVTEAIEETPAAEEIVSTTDETQKENPAEEKAADDEKTKS